MPPCLLQLISEIQQHAAPHPAIQGQGMPTYPPWPQPAGPGAGAHSQLVQTLTVRLFGPLSRGKGDPTGKHRHACPRRQLTESEGCTTVRFILDLKPSGLMKVLDGLITKTMQSEGSQLRELKTVIEEASVGA